jgi:LacI family gluconate utilization system Gnt-I transcriptional repressor
MRGGSFPGSSFFSRSFLDNLHIEVTAGRRARYAAASGFTTEEQQVPGPARNARAPVKITDVAAAAGVAPMTVSRVINTPDRVSAETASRVRAAIERLGYVPNLIAGGLSSRRSRMVAAIVPTIAHPMFAGLVQAFTDAMRGAGYQVMLSLSGYADDDADALLRALLGRRPDALLITGATHSPAAFQMLTEAHVPIVEIWDVSPCPIDMLVGFDHAQVGAAVAEYFLAKGHDRFITISANDPRALIRSQGFIGAVERGGGTMIGNTVLPAPSTIMAGRKALRSFLPKLGARTGLFCSSDLLAFGAITEARQHGIAVPEQLAVCGFGNFELSGAVEPPFTTVNVEGAEAGTLAASFLLRRLAGEPPREEDRLHVPFRIVERGST